MNPEQLGVTPDLAAHAVAAPWLKLALSALVILAALALRWALVRLVRGRAPFLSDRQRWWISLLRNLSTAAIFLGLLAIWAEEIEDFALSLAAVAVAVVIATKELWLCLTGAIWRGASQAFSVGDWIEIGPHSGEVIAEDLLATTLQEIDPRDFHPTGRVISAPNSLLLTSTVINHSFRKRFIYLDFPVYAEPFAGAEAVRARIEAAVGAASEEFAELARRYAALIERNAGTPMRDPAPRVTLDTTDLAKLVFRVTAFCPREKAAALRAAALGAFAESLG